MAAVKIASASLSLASSTFEEIAGDLCPCLIECLSNSFYAFRLEPPCVHSGGQGWRVVPPAGLVLEASGRDGRLTEFCLVPSRERLRQDLSVSGTHVRQ